MKFRGLISDPIAMKEFMNIVTTLSKLSKSCILRIVPNQIFFIISDEDNGPNKPAMWCELPSMYYFKEYYMEGVSTEHNQIFLELSPAMLSKSLISSRNSCRSLKLKLTNKQAPCLTVEIELASDAIQNQQCTHDLPVQVIPRRLWSEYNEPEQLTYNAMIEMPNLKSLKNIVEHMKSMSQYLIISANKEGRLTLSIETNMAMVSAHFTNLKMISFRGKDITENNKDNDTISTRIDVKKFNMFLTSQHVNYSKMSCNIVDETLVSLFLEHPERAKLQCFLMEVSR